MSEYQYYEFQAVDRPLTTAEMQKLRQVSSRATITPGRFVNEYHWGDFKGDAFAWMERYFDAFLYLANWGTRELMLRLPRRLLDLDAARLYCVADDAASASPSGEHVILSFTSDCDGCDEVDGGEGWLGSLLPVRAEIASGDHRALYLAWLLCVEAGEADDDEPEPPVPPGLKRLTAAQAAFAEFLRVEEDLVAAAAERSPEPAEASDDEIGGWIAAQGEAEKTAWLVDVARGAEGSVRAELVRRFRASRRPAGARLEAPRTAGELLLAAERRAEKRKRATAERAARAKAAAEQQKAAARARYLDELATREEETWARVDQLIARKQAGPYDEAAALVAALHELGLRDGRAAGVRARIEELRTAHRRKPGFLQRLAKAIPWSPSSLAP